MCFNDVNSHTPFSNVSFISTTVPSKFHIPPPAYWVHLVLPICAWVEGHLWSMSSLSVSTTLRKNVVLPSPAVINFQWRSKGWGFMLELLASLILCPLSQSLWVHTCSCSAVSGKTILLQLCTVSATYHLSASSSGMFPEPWWKGCDPDVQFKAQHPTLSYLDKTHQLPVSRDVWGSDISFHIRFWGRRSSRVCVWH